MRERVRGVSPLVLLSPALALVLAASALAGETYDLTKLLVREPKAGGPALREVSSESEQGRQVVSQKGKVVQDQSTSKSQAYARKLEVLAASASGDPSKMRYTYESYERSENESKQVLEVEGLVVVVDSADRDAPAKVEAQGGRQVPPFLENKLQDEAQQPPKAEQLQKLTLLLPAGRVGVGQTWEKTPAEAAKALGLPASGLNAKKSSLRGSVSEGSAPGRIKVRIEATLSYSRYQDMRCLEPVEVRIEIVAEVPTAAGDATGSMAQSMKMAGVLESPQGLEVAIDVEQKSETTVTAASK